MKARWQVENDPYCRRVLEKHWPTVRRFGDIREFPGDFNGACDLICGGFPCQDISVAGRGRGLVGARSGLWWEMLRVVQDIRPRFVIIENTPPLYNRGLHAILGCLADEGFDAEWETISARQFGRPHLRKRLFIIAYPNGFRRRNRGDNGEMDGDDSGCVRFATENRWKDGWDMERWTSSFYTERRFPPTDPSTKRVVNGIPGRLDRCRVIGNSVVPAIAEFIGRRIIRCQP